MKTLIIGDVHERIEQFAAIGMRIARMPREERPQRIVQLGDWMDTFKPYSEEAVRELCHSINKATSTDLAVRGPIEWECLLGNHDCHYFFDHALFKCSGYDERRKLLVKELITPDTIRRFKLMTWVGPYLVSHAGFTYTTIDYAKEEVARGAIETALKGEWDPIFGAGRARGGHLPVGGPTWLDWNDEFRHIEGTPQIVGHTYGREVRTRTTNNDKGYKSWCCDTGLRHMLWVDEDNGEVTVEVLAG